MRTHSRQQISFCFALPALLLFIAAFPLLAGCGGDDDDDNCDESTPSIDVCDGIDNDCDGKVDEGWEQYADNDGDGYGSDDPDDAVSLCEDSSPDFVGNDEDCDDRYSNVYPGAEEICDTLDNDCDGLIDEGLPRVELYIDHDGDGYGLGDLQVENCGDPWHASVTGDCDDYDELVNPGTVDVCDERNTDCDEETDEDPNRNWYLDEDEDGFGQTETALVACDAPEGYVWFPDDCDDFLPEINPSEREVCDGVDNDCDGYVDEESERDWFPDEDGDGFGNSEGWLNICEGAEGYVRARGDCDDSDPFVYPGADDQESDEVDSDCGGSDSPEPHVGLSSNSLATIQEALVAAEQGETVWVGPGTYYEGEIRFHKNVVYLMSTHMASMTVVDGSQEWGSVFLIDYNASSDSRLDGFTITGGMATYGGGINITEGSPEIRNCEITHNIATYGGGIYGPFELDSPPLRISNSRITNNSAYTEEDYRAKSKGGGISSQSLVLENCVMSKNSVWAEDLYIDYYYDPPSQSLTGGGVDAEWGSFVSITNCKITDNRIWGDPEIPSDYSFVFGAGALVRADEVAVQGCVISRNVSLGNGGGGGFSGDISLWIADTTVERNRAESYAGLDASSDQGDIQNCWIAGNEATLSRSGGLAAFGHFNIRNTAVIGNLASYGAGVFLTHFADIRNCVFVNNSASVGGGLYVRSSEDSAHLSNSVLAYNKGGSIFAQAQTSPLLFVDYSDIYELESWNSHNLGDLSATDVSLEPGFQGYADGLPRDLHLSLESPLVELGDPNFQDADGSRSDMGIYGGSEGALWDRDQDGWFDYFWPGALSDAPLGNDPELYDSDDADSFVH